MQIARLPSEVKMGPTCEVLLPSDSPDVLDAIDHFLASNADQIDRTRKGRVWSILIEGQIVKVNAWESPPSILLSIAGNSSDDYELLRKLAISLADKFDGITSEPSK